MDARVMWMVAAVCFAIGAVAWAIAGDIAFAALFAALCGSMIAIGMSQRAEGTPDRDA